MSELEAVLEAVITFSSGKGWFFAEDVEDHSAIYIHQKNVVKQRYLRVGERVSYTLAPSERHPGKTQAINVKFIGGVR